MAGSSFIILFFLKNLSPFLSYYKVLLSNLPHTKEDKNYFASIKNYFVLFKNYFALINTELSKYEELSNMKNS